MTASSSRRLRVGMVGGGRGAFIGAVHRTAVEIDGEAQVVAGALSSNARTAAESAAAWYLARSYDDYRQMAATERSLCDGGIDFVIVATPNHLHYPVARAFLEAGIHVVCDKPMAYSLAEAEALAQLAAQGGRTLFALTHTYSGYPLVRHARELVRQGALGTIRKVIVEYNQDWLMKPLERAGNRQAEWRTDPSRAGMTCCVGDIGTHAAHLVEFITGHRISSLCADLSTFVDGRKLDDDANILLRLDGGARGTLVCSQIACGEENDLNIRVYGSSAGLEWRQLEPNTLIFKPADGPWQHLRAGHAYLSPAARNVTRTPAGHPEGYLEAFGNLYRSFIADVRRVSAGETPLRDYPSATDGVRGMRFVEAAVRSSSRGGQWEAV
jgi:predicted dehydrogenase